MSADACLVFYGIRQEIAVSDIHEYETRKHPSFKGCRGAGLHLFWGNFGCPEEAYFVFLGRQIGLIGPQHEIAVQLSAESLAQIVTETRKSLASAGFIGEQQLYIQWLLDV